MCFLADTRAPCNDSVDVDIILSKLNSCTNDPDFDLPSFFACHSVKNVDVPLTREDVIVSHFLNGQCVERKAPGCSEVAHGVRSPVKMVLTITETIVAQCERKQVLLSDLRIWCSAIGVTTTQRPEYATLKANNLNGLTAVAMHLSRRTILA